MFKIYESCTRAASICMKSAHLDCNISCSQNLSIPAGSMLPYARVAGVALSHVLCSFRKDDGRMTVFDARGFPAHIIHCRPTQCIDIRINKRRRLSLLPKRDSLRETGSCSPLYDRCVRYLCSLHDHCKLAGSISHGIAQTVTQNGPSLLSRISRSP